ncbi:unnamed protein product [Miscanthus lutarioriparius]|uniref:Cytochrome P450 n=1 Tax=Miscanthus lutarioriparius TaxID=422564 RepID=A0A811MZJ1_9POAL|nr:unnamed protein product [Miscanthus lutarioriparius]
MVRRLHRATTTAGGGGPARVELKRRLFEVSLSILMEAIAETKAVRPESDADDDTDMSPEAQEFKQVIDEVFPYVSSVWWDYLPVQRWFDVFGVRNKILAERRRMGDGVYSEKKSLIAVLLTLQKLEPEVYTDTMITAFGSVRDSFVPSIGNERLELVARLVRIASRELGHPGSNPVPSVFPLKNEWERGCSPNLFGAGTETTSTTVEWAMSLLLNNPGTLEKARAEIDAAVGRSRLINAGDLPRLGYLRCIIAETLRLYPAAPLLLPHESSADCKVGGYDVPRSTALWEEPGRFVPERFKGGKAEGLFVAPFGMGRRKCPGEALALQTVGVALGSLIQCFHWSRVDGVDVDMSEGSGLSMPKAVPLEALCRTREAMYDVLQKL